MVLRDYLAVIGRRKWTIVLTTLLLLGTAMLFSFLQEPVYASTARVLLRPTISIDTGVVQQLQDPILVQTEVELFRSEPVVELVRQRLNGSAPKVSVRLVNQTTVVEVRAEGDTPDGAAATANAYVGAYGEYKRTQTTNAVVEASTEIQAQVDRLVQAIGELDTQLAALPSCSGPNQPRECDRRSSLIQDRDNLVTQMAPLRQRLNDLQAGSSSTTNGPQVIAAAYPNTDPVRPTPVRNGLLGLGVGLTFGIAVAFAFEHLDDSLKSKEDVETASYGLPVLGMIPAVTSWRNRNETRVISQVEPGSPAAEAYRTLRTSINFLGVDRPMRIIQVTSSNASEGKTTTIANLAVALARAGERVVIVDCDLRRPRIHAFFGLPDSIGFTDVFLGETPLSQALQAVPGEPNLRLLASGKLPPNPSELLSTPRAEQIFSAFRGQNTMVLIDCPPVLPVTDAAVLSARVDGTVLVASAGTTNGKDLARALELLRQVGAPVVGTLLNQVTAEGAYGYQYGYYRSDVAAKKSTNGRKASKAAEDVSPAVG